MKSKYDLCKISKLLKRLLTSLLLLEWLHVLQTGFLRGHYMALLGKYGNTMHSQMNNAGYSMEWSQGKESQVTKTMMKLFVLHIIQV